MISRRISVRRLIVAVAAILLLAVAYIQLVQLDPLGAFFPPEKVDEVQPDKDIDSNILSGEVLDLANPKEVVFPKTPVAVHQPIAFADMQQLQEYHIGYDKSKIGSIYIGYSKFDGTEFSVDDTYERENATFFSLVRNQERLGILKAIQSVEDRFNRKFHYDWVFANDEPFDPELVESIKSFVSGNAYFEVVPGHSWSYPPWIDVDRAIATMEEMEKQKIKYGASELYRHMCRFNSGLFFHLPRMQKYRYYWRVEPEIEFRCDLFEEDWFKYMRLNNKKYAFTLAPLELHTTVTNLWQTVANFSHHYPEYVAGDNNMAFLTEDGGQTYNMCHFWSNFEIGDMDFYRLDAYQAFFTHIDESGGFYYSRWGDAPVHTMAVSLLLPHEELLFLENSGYFHHPNGDCPRDPAVRAKRRCTCVVGADFTWRKLSCIPKWFEVHNITKPAGAPQYNFVNQHHPDN